MTDERLAEIEADDWWSERVMRERARAAIGEVDYE
jgi:hypothetical protein